MSVVLVLLGLLGLLVSGGLTIKALIKKQPKKQYGYAALASAALFIGGVATTDSSPTLSLDAESVETDANGLSHHQRRIRRQQQTNGQWQGSKNERQNVCLQSKTVR
ncbi:hypothetical protein EfsSVR2330_29630 [Enterococcus faecalis]|nr:hypothetical protein EfsSVR2330_29630 [Enterococcus faecalis]